jgi:hypothetical protein
MNCSYRINSNRYILHSSIAPNPILNENQVMPTVAQVSTAECVYGGVTYVIGVYQRSDGLHAYWECKDCQGQGSLPFPEQDCDLALERYLHLVKQHHAVEHLRARRLQSMLTSAK